jgi:predicted SnoaL-like aldol condensation-catalyzing enzyme
MTMTHPTTSTDLEANKNLVRRFIDEVFVAGRPEAIDELVAPEFVSHSFGITEDGPAQLKAATERVHAGLEHVEFLVEDLVAEGDRLAVRLLSSARPTGEFMGVPDAAGMRYSIGEMHFFRIADGRIAEHWHQHDALGLTKQLGAKS